MYESYRERRYHWPEVDAPKDLYSYFVSKQHGNFTSDRIHIWNRETFLKLLDENRMFGEFWEQVCENKPKKAESFASLNDKQMYEKSEWVEEEYFEFLRKKEFNEISKAELKQLHVEFYKLRPKAYQVALEGEALRLNCSVSEVRPLSPLLPLLQNRIEESRLTDMPNALFLNILSRLDTLDVFRVSLVCKRWRNVIYNNPWHLKRAEHAKTTHLITFTKWMDSKRTPSRWSFESDYRTFSRGLLRWCCGFSENLETVILDHPITYVYAVALTQSCPNLKNLYIRCNTYHECTDTDGPFCSDLSLPKLEFYSSRVHYCYKEFYMNMKVLLSSESLLYFGAPLKLDQIPPIDVQDRLKFAFENLVALDIVDYTFDVLEILADVDHMRLKYLGLGKLFSFAYFERNLEPTRLQRLLERILPKLTTLELLKVGGPGIGSSTIKLLTKLKLNLKFAVFQESIEHEPRDSVNNLDERNYFMAEVLADFGQMLLSNDPGLDLSEFFFIVDFEVPQDLIEMEFGFTFMAVDDDYEMDVCEFTLDSKRIKQRLGIGF